MRTLEYEKLLTNAVKIEVMPCRILTTGKWAGRKQNLFKGKALGFDLSILQDVFGFIQPIVTVSCGGGKRLTTDCASAVGGF